MSFNGPIPSQLVDGVTPLTTTTVGPKVALDVSVAKDTTVSNPSIANVAMPLALTEYSYNIPAFTKEFAIKTREGGSLQFTYVSGDSGTNYITVASGTVFSKSNIYSSSVITIYFQSTKANNVLEIMLWS